MRNTLLVPFLFLVGLPAFVFSDGTRVGLDFEETVPFGTDLRWSVSVTNDSVVAKTYRISFLVSSLQYNGRCLGEVESEVSTNAVPAGSSTTASLQIPCSVYSAFSGASETFECNVVVANLFDDDDWEAERMRAFVTFDDSLSVAVVPSEMPSVGERVSATVGWTNSTVFPLTARFSLSASDGLETDDGEDMVDWPPEAIVPGQSVNVSTSLIVKSSSPQTIRFFLKTDKTPVVSADVDVNPAN